MFHPRKPWPGRFWEKVDTNGDCWIWTASKDTSGYGQVRYQGRLRRATHIAWELTNGSVPSDAFLCHRCDNRACVRPDHLFIGDQVINTADMVAKGRQAIGDAASSRLHRERRPRGVAHPKAKLTEDQVREIRRRSIEGESQRHLARAYGVGKNAIQGIVEGVTWRHIL
jgi:hypothetical protein